MSKITFVEKEKVAALKKVIGEIKKPKCIKSCFFPNSSYKKQHDNINTLTPGVY